MSDYADMLKQSVGGLFGELAHADAHDSRAWQSIEELGIPSLFLAETDGGMAGSWRDAEIVFRLAGYHALACPVGETMIARLLLAQAGGAKDDGCPAEPNWWQDDRLDQERAFTCLAFLRTAQLAGALSACLEMCVRYAQERSQFGRELRKFQAIQHQIAILAEEAAAAAAASASAAAALDRSDGQFEVACAKLRANQAVGEAVLIAHQIHGAIGITEELGLHRFTDKLWRWRGDFGNDRHWAQWLGARVLHCERETPWQLLTDGRMT
ncbi:acyl-CoA dehydrogenase family protein [Erythrobacter aurantius]|uniref:acyl-CoA dehydrogenase family protein n=1 Tax=Erythrobacter aurantius TaxID=2909249 RepID=UPI002079464F|nr:acyl-CoA dehydrogenase family protein [Erythrobacter aurantius]